MYERTRFTTTHGVDDQTAQRTLAGAALTTALPVAAVAAVAAPAVAAAAVAVAVVLLVRSPLGRTGAAPDERDPPDAAGEATTRPGGSHYPADD